MNSFSLWLLAEQTVSQYLKEPSIKIRAGNIKKLASRFLSQHIRNEKLFTSYVNWFTKELIIQNTSDAEMSEMLNVMWNEVGDYIIHHLNVNQLQSRFNQKEFTYNQLVNLSHKWHETLDDPKQSRIGAEGRTIINLSDISGFKGWKWVSLDKGRCDREGQAGGHCGNVGAKKDDNILSLRDENNQVHLTFINNGGLLGEMKGRGNSKPSQQYHPAIIKLLLSNYVGSIDGGGYMPENNFSLSDLTPEEQDKIRKQKPFIDNPDKFGKHRGKLSQYYFKSKRIIDLRNAESDDELKSAIKNLAWSKPPNSKEVPPYELSPKDEDVPEIVQRHHIWKAYENILRETYHQAKKQPPEQLFSWMDRAIQIFVKLLVETDMHTLSTLKDKFYFLSMSNISKIDEAIYHLLNDQPEILKGSPSRSKFNSWKEYYAALTRFVDRQGYDMPAYNPNNNHIISYEFLRKMSEEITKQGKPVSAAINKIIKDDKGTDQENLHGVNLIDRHARMSNPNYARDVKRDYRAERSHANKEKLNREGPSPYDDE
jgi:hypothetical protein